MQANENQPVYVQAVDDEIDISELFDKVARKKYFIIAFVFITVVIVAGFISASYLNNAPVKNYSSVVHFNFSSAEKGLYPSGQVFSRSDLITTQVLKRVYEQNNLAEKNIKFEDFSANFTIAPYATDADFIKKKYDALLDNKKLSFTEVESIQKRYAAELKSARSQFAQISYVDNIHLGLTAEVIDKILKDVPKVWSEIAIKELGVLDLKIPGEYFYQSDLALSYEYLQSVQYMKNSVERFRKMLDIVQKDDVGGFIRDTKTGLVVSDLIARLENIKKFELDPLFSVISSLGLVKNTQQAELYLENEIEQIEYDIAEIKQKAKIYREAMRIYADTSGQELAANANSAAGSVGSMVQYGDGFLSKIIGIVEQQKDTEYRQQLLSKQIEFSIQLKAKEIEKEKFKKALAQLKSNSNAEEKQAVTKKFEGDYVSKIADLNNKIINLLGVYQNILELRNVQVLGSSSGLYELVSAKMEVTSDLKSKIKKMILVVTLSAFVALMIAVVIALLSRKKAEV